MGAFSRFDGYRLTLHRADGTVVGSWAAISGERGHHRPSEQGVRDIGPVPEGSYSFSTDNIQKLDSINEFAGFLGRGAWPGSLASWGTERVFLGADPETDTLGRDGFSIHGGIRPGSRGCIDLGPNEEEYFAAVRNLGESTHSISVQYDQQLETQSHPLESQSWFEGVGDYLFRPIPGVLEKLFPDGTQLNINGNIISISYADGSSDLLTASNSDIVVVTTDSAGHVGIRGTIDSESTTVTEIDAEGARPWSEQTTEYNTFGIPTGALTNYETAETWLAVHDLSSAHVDQLDGAAAAAFAAQIEYEGIQGLSLPEGMPSPFSFEAGFGSAYDFALGSYFANPSSTYQPITFTPAENGFDYGLMLGDDGSGGLFIGGRITIPSDFFDGLFEFLGALFGLFSPVVLDLNGDGRLELTSRAGSPVYYDIGRLISDRTKVLCPA